MEKATITMERQYYGTDKDYLAEFTPDAISSAGSFHKPLLGFLRKYDMVKLPNGCYFVSGKDSVAWRTKSSDYEDAVKVAEQIQHAVSEAMDRYFDFEGMMNVKQAIEEWKEERKTSKIT